MVRGFFYNATDLNDKERRYNGEDMSEDKAPFYKEGVVYGHLQVTADGESMAVKVDGGPRTGYAYINLHTIHNTTVLELTVWIDRFRSKRNIAAYRPGYIAE